MSRFHFLNVKNGDCSIIEHNSGNVSIIDVCNARLDDSAAKLNAAQHYSFSLSAKELAQMTEAKKNYNQKANPENPIEYLKRFHINNIFRLAITHPDMDHMDGLKDLFEYAKPSNYYDTANNKKIENGWEGSPYRKEDWDLYRYLRNNTLKNDPKVLRIYSGDNGIHRRRDWEGNPPGDAFFTLAPTPELVKEANDNEDYNDCSYVFMYNSPCGKIIVSGDSHDKTWEHITDVHKDLVSNIELLIAPHHGRKSKRNYEFLDILKPRMTFFGNAPSKDLSYSAWRNRGLEYITNNMAGNMIVDCDDKMSLYVSNEDFARDQNSNTFYSDKNKGWYIKEIANY